MQDNKASKAALAGFTAGAVSTMTLHPLDLIKVQLQVDSQRRKIAGGTLGAAKRIIVQNGWLGLYQGLTPNLLGSTASWGIYFWWYERIKSRLRHNHDRLSAKQHLFGSALAGVLTQVVVNPIWVIKTRMCTQNPLDGDAYKSMFDAAMRMARQEGFSSFYRGMLPSLLGVTHGAIQFMIYEELKIMRGEKGKKNPLEYTLMAAISKTVATIITYPTQVFRSRLQVRPEHGWTTYGGFMDVIKRVWKEEGLMGYYKGLGPNLLRVLPGTMVTFGVYEGMMRLMGGK